MSLRASLESKPIIFSMPLLRKIERSYKILSSSGCSHGPMPPPREQAWANPLSKVIPARETDLVSSLLPFSAHFGDWPAFLANARGGRYNDLLRVLFPKSIRVNHRPKRRA